MYAFGEGRGAETDIANGGDALGGAEGLQGVPQPLANRLLVASGATVPADIPALFVGEPPAEAPQQHVARRAWCFPERPDGSFAEEFFAETAIAQLQDLRRSGATFLIFPITAFGWLAERPDLAYHLNGHYRLVVDDEACRVFDLRRSPIGAFLDSILPPDEPVIAILREGTELELGGRQVRRLEAASPDRIEAMRLEGVRFLVVADMSPWAPADAGIVSVLEQRYPKLASRPGLCELFDLGGRSRGRQRHA